MKQQANFQSLLLSKESQVNYSYFAPIVAYGACMFPHYAAMFLAGFRVYDNSQPRNFLNNIASDKAMTASKKNRLMRLEGASLNGFETLGFFCAAVACANQVSVDVTTLNRLSFGYVAARVAYIFVYTSTSTRPLSWIRNAAWNVGIWINITLWVRAGLEAIRQSS